MVNSTAPVKILSALPKLSVMTYYWNEELNYVTSSLASEKLAETNRQRCLSWFSLSVVPCPCSAAPSCWNRPLQTLLQPSWMPLPSSHPPSSSLSVAQHSIISTWIVNHANHANAATTVMYTIKQDQNKHNNCPKNFTSTYLYWVIIWRSLIESLPSHWTQGAHNHLEKVRNIQETNI